MAGSRLTLTKLSDKIEKYMDSVALDMSRSNSNRQIEKYDNQLKGMENLAKRLGVDCSCFYTKWADKPRTVCKCKVMPLTRRTKIRD